MSAHFQNNLQDRVGIWLDENMGLLSEMECLIWPHQNVIPLAEVLRAGFFERVFLSVAGRSGLTKRRKAMKFPTSVISRVDSAITHLSRCAPDEVVNRNVVFLPQTLAQLAHQLPVARELSQTGKTCGFILPGPAWAKGMSLDQNGIIACSRALQSKILCARLKSRVMWLRLSRGERLAVPPFEWEDQQIDLGAVLLDAVLDYLNASFEGYALGKYILEFVQPKLIAVSGELQPGVRVLVAFAKQKGLRCVDMSGAVRESPMDSYRLCDRFVVYGNYGKRALAGSGIDTRKIKACGAPYLDELALKRPLSFLSRAVDQGDPNRKFILVDVADKWAPTFWRTAQIKNENFFLFLTHRAVPIIQGQLKTGRNFRLRQRNGISSTNLAACLKTADLVITDKISVALDALSIGKSVAAFNYQDTFDDQEFLKTRLVQVIAKEDDLIRPFSTVPDDLHARQMFEDYFFRKDGNCAQRVASVIVEECQK